ncbi:uncharacterized protein LOC119768591 [Culex quinquefasciatus]|uniref:uncharacterized protein LOC119768591 n=1 Tax=Culex quinquefasciatus TaxID=7176 RepID=UPI0018E2E090|nr:uncharacterized protein LOC119768591 [Culex quinquefasciatus]
MFVVVDGKLPGRLPERPVPRRRSGQDCATIKSGVVRRRRLSSIAAETEGQCPGVGPAAAVNLTVSGSARNRATFRGQRRAGAARDLDIPGPLGFIPSFPP